MRPPKVSICLPTYNRAGYLRKCIRSILAQSYADLEVIVLDNASSDDTGAVVREFDDPRLQYHRNERNIGPFGNMNLGISLARGEYICIAHDDDAYLPDFVERVVSLLEANPSMAMAHSAVFETEPNGERRRILRAYPATRVLPGRREFVRFLEGHNVCCSSVIARRRAYAEAGVFDPRYLCADFHMWLRLALRGDVGYVADPLVEMRIHSESGSAGMEPQRWYSEFMAILEEGVAMGAAMDPALVADERAIRRRAARAQGWRFFIAGLAAIRHGRSDRARGYAAVVEKFSRDGASRLYAPVVRLLMNPLGRTFLSVVTLVRAANARRQLGAASR